MDIVFLHFAKLCMYQINLLNTLDFSNINDKANMNMLEFIKIVKYIVSFNLKR